MPSTSQRVWGGDSEKSINAVNQWMRTQPWYQQQLAAWGIKPGADVDLSKNRRKQLLKLAQANGVVVDEGKIEVDPAGNFNPKGHKLRNGLIIAGIAAGGYFAAPAIAGALGSGAAGAGGASAAGAAGTGGTLASTGTIGLGTLASGAPSSLMAAGGSAGLAGGAAAAGGLGAGALGSGATTGVTAAASSPSIWRKIAGPVIEQGIPAAANIIGTKMQVNAERDAAKMQAEAEREALAWQKEQYAQRQRQLAPAIGVGNGATVRLGELMGIQTPQGGYGPQTQTGINGQPVNPPPAPATVTGPNGEPGRMAQRNPESPATTFVPSANYTGETAVPRGGAPAQGVLMRAPNGQQKLVDPGAVAHYEQLGAVRV